MTLEKLREKAADARAEAERAAKAFKTTPSQQTLAEKEIKAQLATNADEAVAREEQRLSAEELARKRGLHRDALERASVTNWRAAIAPKLDALDAAATKMRAIYAEIVAITNAQGAASTEAAQLGAEFGEPLTRDHAPLAHSQAQDAVAARLQAYRSERFSPAMITMTLE